MNMRRQRANLRARGLRGPRHTGLVTCEPQRLYPFFAAPIRPQETLAGMSINGSAFLNLMSRMGTTPPMMWEIGVWKVPLSVLGPEYIQLLMSDAEDVADLTSTTNFINPGTGVATPSSGPALDDHLSGTALGYHLRPWAGEIGLTSGTAGESQATYARYVSQATYHVAQIFYDLEWGDYDTPNIGYVSTEMMDEPPRIADPIRGASYSGIWAGGTNDQGADQAPDFANESPFGQSLAEWAERLSLMGNPNLTYADWLKAYGTDIRRVGSIPEPVLYRRGVLRPHGSPQSWHVGANWDGPTDASTQNDFVLNTSSGEDARGNYVTYFQEATDPDSGLAFAGDRAGIVKYGASYRMRKRRNIIADEPSILLGCFMWSPWQYRESQFAHHLDVNRLLNSRHWGPPIGGIDESDFLTAQLMYGSDGLGQADEDEGGVESSIRAMNLLNLYMNGDAFCNDPLRWGWHGPMAESDSFTLISDLRVDASMDVRLAILTDMVK